MDINKLALNLQKNVPYHHALEEMINYKLRHHRWRILWILGWAVCGSAILIIYQIGSFIFQGGYEYITRRKTDQFQRRWDWFKIHSLSLWKTLKLIPRVAISNLRYNDIEGYVSLQINVLQENLESLSLDKEVSNVFIPHGEQKIPPSLDEVVLRLEKLIDLIIDLASNRQIMKNTSLNNLFQAIKQHSLEKLRLLSKKIENAYKNSLKKEGLLKEKYIYAEHPVKISSKETLVIRKFHKNFYRHYHVYAYSRVIYASELAYIRQIAFIPKDKEQEVVELCKKFDIKPPLLLEEDREAHEFDYDKFPKIPYLIAHWFMSYAQKDIFLTMYDKTLNKNDEEQILRLIEFGKKHSTSPRLLQDLRLRLLHPQASLKEFNQAFVEEDNSCKTTHSRQLLYFHRFIYKPPKKDEDEAFYLQNCKKINNVSNFSLQEICFIKILKNPRWLLNQFQKVASLKISEKELAQQIFKNLKVNEFILKIAGGKSSLMLLIKHYITIDMKIKAWEQLHQNEKEKLILKNDSLPQILHRSCLEATYLQKTGGVPDCNDYN